MPICSRPSKATRREPQGERPEKIATAARKELERFNRARQHGLEIAAVLSQGTPRPGEGLDHWSLACRVAAELLQDRWTEQTHRSGPPRGVPRFVSTDEQIIRKVAHRFCREA